MRGGEEEVGVKMVESVEDEREERRRRKRGREVVGGSRVGNIARDVLGLNQ